jgi:hypothetical protein
MALAPALSGQPPVFFRCFLSLSVCPHIAIEPQNVAFYGL